MEYERVPKRFLVGNFVIEAQWENQEQDGSTSAGGTHHRSQKYEDGEDEQKAENNEGVF
jgi:hypothetical protein